MPVGNSHPLSTGRPTRDPHPGTRLVIVAAVLALLLTLAGGLLAWRTERAERRRASEETLQIARNAALEADRFLADRLALLAVLSASPPVRSADVAAMRAAFIELPRVAPDLGTVAWADLDGNVRATTPPDIPAPGINVADREHFVAVLAGGAPFVSAALSPRNPNLTDRSVVLAVPSRNLVDGLTGVLVNTISVKSIAATLSTFTPRTTGRLLVVDRAGQVIIDSDDAQVSGDVSGSPLLLRARSGRDGVMDGITGLRGDDGQLVAYAAAPTGNWAVFIERPVDQAFGAARRAFLWTLLMLVGLALSGIGATVWAGRRLDRTAAVRAREEEAQRFLAEASDVLAGSLEVNTLLEDVARLSVPRIADICIIYILNPEGEPVRQAMVHADPGQQATLDRLREFTVAKNPDATLWKVIESGQGVVVSRIVDRELEAISESGAHVGIMQALKPTSSLHAPLRVRGRTLGSILLLMAGSGRYFSEQDLPLAEDLARRTATALDNAGLYREAQVAGEQLRRRAEQQSTLAAASRYFAEASLDYDSVIDKIAQQMAEATGDGCIVRLFGPDGSTLGAAAAAHPDPEAASIVRNILLDQRTRQPGAIPQRAMEQQGPVLLPANGQELRDLVDPSYRPYIDRYRVSSIVAMPLIVQGRVLGTMTVSREGDRSPLSAGDVGFLGELADRAAVAIDNARLYAAERGARTSAEQAAERTARLQAVTAALSEAMTPAEVAEATMREGLPAVGAVAGAVFLLSRDGTMLQALHTVGYPQGVTDGWAAIPVSAQAPSAEAVRNREPVWIERTSTYRTQRGTLSDVLSFPTPHGHVAVPLSLKGHLVGAMSLSFDGERSFLEEDRLFIQALASACAQSLERARLYQSEAVARREAESANQAKDDFLSTLSHELRTPLTSMLGWARLLRTRRLDSTSAQEGLETIERNARAQARLVEDLLDVSRIVGGKLSLTLEPVELAPLVEATVESARPLAEAAGVALTLRITDTAGTVRGDPVRLEQVLSNLLSNAVKFTPEGGMVAVSLGREGRTGCIEVRDTGMGIEPAFLPFVFDRFRQADASSTRRYGGLGLGLAIVRHLTEMHGGTVTAESEGEGHGSVFTLRLPLDRVTGSAPETGHTEPVASGDDLGGLRVLLVEDDDDSRMVLAELLRFHGARVAEANSTSAALALLDREPPEVLVSDIGMPGDDGYSLIERVRAREQEGVRLPAIALTAYAGAEDRARAIDAGYDLHLAKPADADDLVRAIRKIAPIPAARDLT